MTEPKEQLNTPLIKAVVAVVLGAFVALALGAMAITAVKSIFDPSKIASETVKELSKNEDVQELGNTAKEETKELGGKLRNVLNKGLDKLSDKIGEDDQ